MNINQSKGKQLLTKIDLGFDISNGKLSGVINSGNKQYKLSITIQNASKGLILISNQDVARFDYGDSDYSISFEENKKYRVVDRGKILIGQLTGDITGTGLQGIAGLQGLSIQGLIGIQGNQGVYGVQGLTGSQGITGVQGIQGLQGIQGISIQGLQGVQGLQGTQGLLGIQGITAGDILLASEYNKDAVGGILLCSQYNI